MGLGERSVRRIVVAGRSIQSGYRPKSVSFGEDATKLAISHDGTRLVIGQILICRLAGQVRPVPSLYGCGLVAARPWQELLEL